MNCKCTPGRLYLWVLTEQRGRLCLNLSVSGGSRCCCNTKRFRVGRNHKPTQGVQTARGSTRHDVHMTILEKVEWCYWLLHNYSLIVKAIQITIWGFRALIILQLWWQCKSMMKLEWHMSPLDGNIILCRVME